MESPASAQAGGSCAKTDGKGSRRQPRSTTLDLGYQFWCMGEDRAVVFDTGAAANLVHFRWLGDRSLLSGKHGLPRVLTNPACARFKSGDGPLGDVRFAADIAVRLAGCNGASTALVLGADTPALLRKAA